MTKLGLIAGGGGLPVALADQCRAAGRPIYVIRLKGFADPALLDYEGAEIGLGELGRCFDLLHAAGCQAVCFAGKVSRPDFASLKPDGRGLKAIGGVILAARKGEDAILRHLLGLFEQEGFRVEGAHEVAGSLNLGQGPLGRLQPSAEDLDDIAHGFRVAGEIGRMDVGQGVVACRGLILAVEAQEGTDAMLARCAGLPAALRGDAHHRKGVLVKRAKPTQEERMDLPTLGVDTLEGAAKAGLAGVVGEAGRTLLVDGPAVIAAADRLGLFLYGHKEG